MGFNIFKSKASRELDEIITGLEMNMSNNYKDAAGEDFEKLKRAYEEMCKGDKLKEKEVTLYNGIIVGFAAKLEGYSHKDQKPYWH
ncbi:MAG: hypothetical protein K6E63_11945 [Lachnospiraceae bacterium]|nr:hypothetical protein [Lachnospiraceae bacterium]